MKSSQIFGLISDYLISHNMRDSNVQISSLAGIERRRIAQIKKNPRLMTIGELENLANAFDMRITITRKVL